MPFHITNWSRSLLEAALALLSPPVCFLCGEPTHRERRALCWECLRKNLLGAENVCGVCGIQMPGPGQTCGDCSHERPAFMKARAAVVFAGGARKLVHFFKYRKSLWLRGDFGEWLHGCFLAHYADAIFDCIVPVPVSRVKFFQRGYNQSEFLARDLGKKISLPVLPRALARRGNLFSATQTTLSRSERAANVARAFYVAQPKLVEGRDILLLDDVFTTGATANACARALKKAGAESVRVITVARGVMD